MTKRLISCLILLALTLSVRSAELVQTFSGSGSSTTREFEVEAPWILDWRVNSDYQKSMAIEVHLIDGMTGFQEGLILKTRFPGNGVRLFRESGRFRLRVSATLSDWTLKVEELTEEEAELYTPARSNPLQP